MAVGFEISKETKDEWLTPPNIIYSLGEFDLDPCSPVNRPWDTALKHYTYVDNGLMQNWEGRVWMNPPYGRHTTHWLNKMVLHGNGIAFIPARTETGMFFNYVWSKASSIFFVKGRVFFHDVSGNRGKDGAGFPSCLIAYGNNNSKALRECGLSGKYIELN